MFRSLQGADFVFISFTERIFVFCFLGGSRIECPKKKYTDFVDPNNKNIA